MSLHTKIILLATMACNFAVCLMTFLAVEQGTVPTLAMNLIPFALFGWPVALISSGLDAIITRT